MAQGPLIPSGAQELGRTDDSKENLMQTSIVRYSLAQVPKDHRTINISHCFSAENVKKPLPSAEAKLERLDAAALGSRAQLRKQGCGVPANGHIFVALSVSKVEFVQLPVKNCIHFKNESALIGVATRNTNARG